MSVGRSQVPKAFGWGIEPFLIGVCGAVRNRSVSRRNSDGDRILERPPRERTHLRKGRAGGIHSHDQTKYLSGDLYNLRRSRGEEEGMYELIVWDVATKKRLATFFKGWTVDYHTRTFDGLPITGFRFSDDDRSIIITDQQENEETYEIQYKSG